MPAPCQSAPFRTAEDRGKLFRQLGDCAQMLFKVMDHKRPVIVLVDMSKIAVTDCSRDEFMSSLSVATFIKGPTLHYNSLSDGL